MGKWPVNLITVLGHTAAGKTAFAAHLAHHLGGEIISADSRQIYRGMDIGTGKDYADYMVDGDRVPVHLIDIVEAGFEYNVYLFKQDFFRVYNDVVDRQCMPLLCGGSGLYLEAVLRNYKLPAVPVNPVLRRDLEEKSNRDLEAILKHLGPLHNITDTSDRKRLIRAIEIAMFQGSRPDEFREEQEVHPLVIGIQFDRIMRRERITTRLKERMQQGMVEEVNGLMQQGITAEKLDYYGLEYRYISKYLLHEYSYEEMFQKLNTAIHQFAKRQMTYFRGMERRGVTIHWMNGKLPMEEKVKQAFMLLDRSGTTDGPAI